MTNQPFDNKVRKLAAEVGATKEELTAMAAWLATIAVAGTVDVDSAARGLADATFQLNQAQTITVS